MNHFAIDNGMEDGAQAAGSMPPEMESAARRFIAGAGFPADCGILQLKGGANNRVFRVEAPDGPLLLKAYFQHPDDPRDRLGAEFSFARFAWNHGARALPRPLARNDELRFGLYEYIFGRPPLPEDVTLEAVKQATLFYQQINNGRNSPDAKSLPQASEACFTLAEHLQCVRRRIEKLGGISKDSALDGEAAALVAGPLSKKWAAASGAVLKQTGAGGICEIISGTDRRISPSDFGFHNAIFCGGGQFRFIDFEYAGWDDPAKTVCDFFCQPAVPVPREFYDMFAGAIAAGLAGPEAQLRRMSLLMPVYQLKWVCILLNDFLPAGGARRSYALSDAGCEERKIKQIAKARRALERIEI